VHGQEFRIVGDLLVRGAYGKKIAVGTFALAERDMQIKTGHGVSLPREILPRLRVT
jgi:hypothetical protein